MTDTPSDGLTMAIFGLIMLVIGAVAGVGSRGFLQGATRTTGTVLEVHVRHGEYASYHPLVRFHDLDGTERLFTDHRGGGKRRYHVGQSVLVAYDPQDPSKARVPHFVTSLVFCGVGGVSLVIGLVVWLGA